MNSFLNIKRNTSCMYLGDYLNLLVFFLSFFVVVAHYVILFLSTRLKIKEKHISRSEDLVKFVIGAFIGSIIGGNA